MAGFVRVVISGVVGKIKRAPDGERWGTRLLLTEEWTSNERPQSRSFTLPVVGNLPAPAEGESVIIEGRLVAYRVTDEDRGQYRDNPSHVEAFRVYRQQAVHTKPRREPPTQKQEKPPAKPAPSPKPKRVRTPRKPKATPNPLPIAEAPPQQ